MSESEVYTIGHAWVEQNARANGEPTEAEKEQAKRMAKGPFVHKKIRDKRKAIAESEAERRRLERREAMGLNPDGTLPEPEPEELSATERIALAETKKPSRKTVVTAVEDTNPRPKMTQLEFDGKMDLHRKIMEKDSSGKWVHNCAAARTYRKQAWEFKSKQRDEAGELIRTEHPDVRAVQLAAV